VLITPDPPRARVVQVRCRRAARARRPHVGNRRRRVESLEVGRPQLAAGRFPQDQTAGAPPVQNGASPSGHQSRRAV